MIEPKLRFKADDGSDLPNLEEDMECNRICNNYLEYE